MLKMVVKLIFKDKFLTKFMQNAGMFEKFKVIVAGVMEVEITPKDGGRVDDSMLNDLIEKAKDFCKEEKFELIGLVAVNGYTWFDETVKSVSNGGQWMTVENYIEELKSGSDWPYRM